MSTIRRMDDGADSPSMAEVRQVGLRNRLSVRVQMEYESLLDGLRSRVARPLSQDPPDGGGAGGAVTGNVSRAFRLALSCLTDGSSSLTVGALAAMHDIGAAQARAGVSLAAVERDLRSALSFCHGQLLAAARAEAPSQGLLFAVSELSIRLAELTAEASEAITTGYEDLGGRHSADLNCPAAQFVDAVLDSDLSQDRLPRVAAESGCVTQGVPALLVVIMSASATRADVRAAATEVVGVAAGALQGSVRSHPCPHAAVLAAGVDQPALVQLELRLQRVAERYGFSVLVVPGASLQALGRTYRQLRAHLLLAPDPVGSAAVLSAHDLTVCRLLSSVDKGVALEFLRETLGPVLRLPAAQRAPLLETLVALQRGDGSLRGAATRLGLHAKSVGYRTRRIAELTGLRISVPAERARLDLATHVLRLHPASGGWRHLSYPRDNETGRSSSSQLMTTGDLMPRIWHQA